MVCKVGNFWHSPIFVFMILSSKTFASAAMETLYYMQEFLSVMFRKYCSGRFFSADFGTLCAHYAVK